MDNKQLADIRLPQKEERMWELYHENSKLSPWQRGPHSEDFSHMLLARMHLSLPSQSEWVKKLEIGHENLNMSLQDSLNQRRPCQQMEPKELGFEEVSSLLHAGLGITRQEPQSRGIRSAPSAGNAFPVEAFFYASQCKHLPKGLYHFNPEKEEMQLLRRGDHESVLANALVENQLVKESSLIIFLTGVLGRTTLFFGERGYRLALLEAGHIAQNILLAATAMKLGCLNVSEYYDRKLEKYLDIDGIDHTILDVIVIGTEKQITK